MKKQSKSLVARLSKSAKAIKVSAHLNNSIENSAFLEKKMKRARKVLAEAGIPKIGRAS